MKKENIWLDMRRYDKGELILNATIGSPIKKLLVNSSISYAVMRRYLTKSQNISRYLCVS
jgi:hypothetical protein